MNIDFQVVLLLLILVSGLLVLHDVLFLAPKRRRKLQILEQQPELEVNERQREKILRPSWPFEYARSFFPIFLIVIIVRSFIVQPFRVPTGSLEPTVLPGDFIAVNQFAYGLHLPVTNQKIVSIGEPRRGDVAVFHWPIDPRIDYVKRVIGLPGDHIQYIDKVLYINGHQVQQQIIGKGYDIEPSGPVPVLIKQENLFGVKHKILVRLDGGEQQNFDFQVPAGEYFMMGDNRDNSADSRFWGYVPEKDLIGKAFLIWMSWDSDSHSVRWNRIGKVL